MDPETYKIEALIQAVRVTIGGDPMEPSAETVARAKAYYDFLTS